MLKRRSFVDIWDDVCPGEPKEFELVFWLSRHSLSREQEEVIFYVHDGPVRVEHVKCYFKNASHMAQIIMTYSKLGTVYCVVPKRFEEEVEELGLKLKYRKFCGFVDDNTKEYVFKCLYQKDGKDNEAIFSLRNLDDVRGRVILA